MHLAGAAALIAGASSLAVAWVHFGDDEGWLTLR